MPSLKKRVLIVDDEEDLTWTLSKKLSKDSDKFGVITVNSGREAIEVLNQLPVDLVITDIRMPEVSGLELLVEIKEKYPHTKVIIMTAYGSSDMQKSANERGCFRYIEKPFEINELRQFIIEALTERKGFKGSVSDFQLSDIIQLNCLGRLTSALQVSHDHEKGLIYFDEGNIVHAETDKYQGENAFYYIMSWQGGEFSVKRNMRASRETIRKGWQSLLLEALRRVDEHSDSMVADKEREKRQRIHKIHWALNSIIKTRGVEFVLLHNTAGFPITFLPDTPETRQEAPELATHLSNYLKANAQLQKQLHANPAVFFEIHFGDLVFISRKIPAKDAYVTILAEPGVNIGFLRLELRKKMKEIQSLI